MNEKKSFLGIKKVPFFTKENLQSARLGVNRIRRGIQTAVKSEYLRGGEWPENFKRSHYLQYSPQVGRKISVLVSGDTFYNVSHIEYGRPCGVLIINHEDGKTDFFPEEVSQFEVISS